MKKIYLVCVCGLLLSGCAASIPAEQLEEYAFIRSGSTNAWSLMGGGSAVSLKAINGVEKSGSGEPIPVVPGRHVITMECAGTENEFELTFKAGEIYEYAYGTGGTDKCFGSLIKVN